MALHWRILILLFLVRCTMAFQFATIGGIGPLLSDSYTLDIAGLGWIVGLYFLPGVVVALPGGSIARRFGDERVILFGLALMTAGSLIMALQPPLSVFSAARLMAGIGGILMNVLMSKLVLDWFANRQIATAMVIFINSWPAGIGLSLVVQPWLAAQGGVALPFAVETGLIATALAAFFLFYRRPDTEPVTTGTPARAVPQGAILGAVLVAGFSWGAFNASLAALLSFGSTSLVDRGMSLELAGLSISIVSWTVVVTGTFGGWLTDRTGRPAMVLLTGLSLFGLALFLFPRVPPMLITMALIGLLSGIPVAGLISLPARVLKPEQRAIGMGLFYTVYYACFAILPGLGGKWAESAGTVSAAFEFAAFVIVLAILGVFVFLPLSRRV
ncbi:MFS transporter [Ruegeria sp. WL0004]|uniref:MFS transporter n=1 Tax=Ruegeria marisflavi TaxID=2984152 RepID=A0ABT2WX67_9RHOB|nr:MFS transporter [Ruegeria sp. WL0004]MCU9839862.1 MFS transporter [Ruegeria sp. WL0004]